MASEESDNLKQTNSVEEGNSAEHSCNEIVPTAKPDRAGQPHGAEGNSGIQTGMNGVVVAIPSEEQYLCMNHRRIELIRKQNRMHLTAEEATEFERLDAAVGAYVNHHHPLPTLHLREIEELARGIGVEFPSSTGS